MHSFSLYAIPDVTRWMTHCTNLYCLIDVQVMGESREPNLAFDRSHFNFRALLLGHEAREVVYLVNPEENDFSFGFLESSRHAPGYSSSLQVSPSSGVVPARSK